MEQQVTNKSYSLTKAQKRVWFNSKLLDKPLPNIVMVFELLGNLDIWALRKALEILVDENSVLKSTIYSSTDHLERIINPAVRGNLEVVDLTQTAKITDIFWLLQNIAGISFNLGTGPLFHFHLIKEAQDHFYFTILIHPIIVDRYSLKHLVSEISRHYNLIAHGKDASHREELFDFNNIVELEKKFYASDKCRQGLTHWTNTLKTCQFQIDLPGKGYFPGQEYADSPFFEILLDERVANDVKEYAASHQVNFEVVLLCAYQALLQRYTGNDDIVINYSSSVSYTNKKIFGCLENRLPLRVLLSENLSFNELLKLTKTQMTYDHYYKDVQINDIVKSIRDKYDTRFSGSFSNTSFDENYLPYNQLNLGSVTAKLIPKFMKKFVTESIAFYYRDTGDSISLIADVDEHIDSIAVKNLMKHYEVLLSACLQDPNKPLAQLPILTAQEHQQLVVEWNKTDEAYPHDFVNKLFEKKVTENPDKIAIIFENQQLTYGELNHKANQLAHLLRQQLEQTPPSTDQNDKLIGICLNRSLEMVISMLAILKAGAGYVPLDPTYPEERLLYILEDTKLKVIISHSEVADTLTFLSTGGRHVVCLDKAVADINHQPVRNLDVTTHFSQLAYIIYTSGSTGVPKGVMIEHRSFPNIVYSFGKYFQLSPEKKVLQFSSMNFDAVIPEVFSTLAHGATLYIVSEELRQSTEKLIEFLDTHAITTAVFPPALLRILPRQALPALDTLAFAGDVCDQETVDYWSKGRRFINGYGPTEVTVYSTYGLLQPGDLNNRLGRPLPNYKAYILDKHLNPVPVGMIGELYIGGLGLGRGYVNRPEMTAERFIPNPFSIEASSRLYKTGDLVRYLADSNIEYIGRADFEVKIRGFRIQLGDIEYVLQSHPGVRHVTTKIWHKAGMEKVIAAYYVLKEYATIQARELRDYLQKQLPEYMVPGYLFELEELPILVNGKINKAQLPDPFPRVTSANVANHEEAVLKEIWSELFKLSIDAVSGHSDFFDLGGHSLLATQLVSRIKNRLNADISVKDVFQNSQLKQLAKVVRETQSQLLTQFVLEKAAATDLYEPSFSQMRLWYFSKVSSRDQTYNILFSIIFSSTIDIIALRKSLVKLFSSHEVFRTTFVESKGEVRLKIHDALSCDIPIIDCQTKEDIQSEIDKEKSQIFTLDKLPLFRCKLLLSETHGVTLVFNIHHILFDGWSLDVFMRELGEMYMQITQNKLLDPVRNAFEFKDFAQSQKNWEKAGLFDEQLIYWQRKLFNPLPILELPTDFRRPAVAEFAGDAVRFALPENLVVAAKKLAAANKTSLFSLFLTVYYILLHRVTHQHDLIVASPIANRTQQDLEQLVGLFANVVAYRTRINENMPFDALLKRVNEDVIDTQDNQDVPFDMIVNKLQTSRDTSRHPIFQTMFVLQSGFKLSNQWPESGITYQITEEHTKTSKFDMTFILYDHSAEDAVSGYFEFNTALYRKETIARYVQYFINILRSITDNSQRAIENIQLLPSDEYKMVVHDWNRTANHYNADTIYHMFERQVALLPSQTAVVFQNEKVTYHELNMRANQLARVIRSQYVQLTRSELLPGTVVGLCLDRSIEMIVGILAILKAGAAYLPLDPHYPRERLTFMLNDTSVKMIISKQNCVDKFDFLNNNHHSVICLDNSQDAITSVSPLNLEVNSKPSDLAYIIYTSGSTGVPKGVMVEHKGVPNLANACRDLFNLTPHSRVLQFASINFDAAIFEIFNTLLNGATLYVLSDEQRLSPEKLVDFIDENHISFATLPPALLRIMPHRELPSLTTLAFAGDICDQETMNYWARNRNFFNAYGPTEATVCVTASQLMAGEGVNRIGKPLSNFKVYILDSQLSPVPIGVLGELYIGGVGMARGYLNRADLTVERFIVNPFSDDPSEKLYKTGDVVRWCANGEIEYIGRSDFQVQIRGFRVELGEIEAVLSQHHAIKQVAVTVTGDDVTKQLFAYFTLHSAVETVAIEELRKYLQSKLPDYMIPNAFIKIDKMPISPSGKIDKKSLPAMSESVIVAQNHFIAPRTETENKLALIWEALFNHHNIGVRDNFFHLGGNSLLSIRMLARVKEVFGRDISLSKFFQHPTIEGLTDLVAGHEHALDQIAAVMADAEMNVLQHSVSYSSDHEVKNILLTGANGFLGAYLLDALLRHSKATIYCLIRGRDQLNAQEKLAVTLTQFGLDTALDNPRVHVIMGDLASPKLGLDAKRWAFFEENIDAVYHSGALVNHIYDYQIVKSTNVGSTVELLKLCASKKAKYFHYISTNSAASQFNESGIALEAGPGNKPPLGVGYILSKWVSERIIYRAAEHGLKVTIYRPGNITGHSVTGQMNFENNHALLLLKSCAQLGVAPAWKAHVEMTPVDVVSEAIIRLSLVPEKSQKQAYNMGNPHSIAWQDYFTLVDKYGFKMKLIAPQEWRDNYIKHIGIDNALYPLKELYTQGDAELEQFHFETTITQQALQKLQIHYPDNYENQIPIYLNYLNQKEFIERVT